MKADAEKLRVAIEAYFQLVSEQVQTIDSVIENWEERINQVDILEKRAKRFYDIRQRIVERISQSDEMADQQKSYSKKESFQNRTDELKRRLYKFDKTFEDMPQPALTSESLEQRQQTRIYRADELAKLQEKKNKGEETVTYNYPYGATSDADFEQIYERRLVEVRNQVGTELFNENYFIEAETGRLHDWLSKLKELNPVNDSNYFRLKKFLEYLTNKRQSTAQDGGQNTANKVTKTEQANIPGSMALNEIFQHLRSRFDSIPSIGVINDFFADWNAPTIPRDEFIRLALKLDRFEAMKLYGRPEVRNIKTPLMEQIELTDQIFGEERLFSPRIYKVGDVEYLIGFENEHAHEIGQYLIGKNKNEVIEGLKIGLRSRIESLDDENRKQTIIKAEIARIEQSVGKGKLSDVPSMYAVYVGYDSEERMDRFHFMQPFTHDSYRQTLNGAAFFHYSEWLKKLSLSDENKTTSLELIFLNPEYYQACLDILNKYSLIKLGPRNGASVFFGITDAFKTYSRRLLNPTPQETWSDEMIVAAFNSHLKTNFGGKKREIKRGGILQKKVKAEVEAILSKL